MATGDQHEPHGHAFGQDRRRPGERRTVLVVVITGITMVAEIAGGLLTGSMALLADGLHMGSHAAALTIAALAYLIARRHAHDRRFSFGTGKVNALGGFVGALLLLGFAGLMAWESVDRLIFRPHAIQFGWALAVAAVGAAINALCLLVLKPPDEEAEDHNLRGAYLHVLVDLLTSVLAIVALLAGWLLGWGWLDPAVGVIGAVMVVRWSIQLGRDTAKVLLDWEAPSATRDLIRDALQADGQARVFDLHVWSIGPGLNACALSVLAVAPKTPEEYKALIPKAAQVAHATVEIHRPGPDDEV
ncbi:MAG: cation diffusion facilitator family transporter [Alphaproteobacteria bacterium]